MAWQCMLFSFCLILLCVETWSQTSSSVGSAAATAEFPSEKCESLHDDMIARGRVMLQSRSKDKHAETSGAQNVETLAHEQDDEHMPRFWGHTVSFVSEGAGSVQQPPALMPPAAASEPYVLKKGTFQSSYSQWGQDLILLPILSMLGKGFFVESGAYEGELDSNTLLYELKYGWTGLLVEPDPTYLPQLQAKRRRAYLYPGCLSPSNVSMTIQFQIGQGGLSKVNGGGSYSVQAQPLHELLAPIGQATVDFWSLDIEGSEGAVLQNTDFTKVEVGVLLIEVNSNPANTKLVSDVMAREGFLTIGHTNYNEGVLDNIYVNPKYFEKRSLPVPSSSLLGFANRDGMPAF
mmetsp:Transcript_88860/g.167449  ORF Transcript_88860/g.167449 Transcript_88860/m.167449 type:complete len:348 (+) Transcript_88860:45-1088(+)